MVSDAATVGPSGTSEVDAPYVHLGIRFTADDNGYADSMASSSATTTRNRAPGGSGQQILTPLKLLDRLAAVVPPPARPPPPLLRRARAQLTAALSPHRPRAGSNDLAARYAWARLLARIYEVFPLVCSHGGDVMRIIRLHHRRPDRARHPRPPRRTDRATPDRTRPRPAAIGACPMPAQAPSTPSPHRSTNSINASLGNAERRPPAKRAPPGRRMPALAGHATRAR